MSRLEFIKKLYNGKNCYSDHMSDDELNLLHITSNVEGLIVEMLSKGKIIFLTGNPGDGKTFIIKAVDKAIQEHNAYVEKDMNNISEYDDIVNDIINCYKEHRSAIIAVNEYPFMQLCKHIKSKSPDIYTEVLAAKKCAITYSTSSPLTGRVAIIDLNERNLLDSNRNLLDELIDKFIALISEDAQHNKYLENNIKALSTPEVKEQVLALMQFAALECEHFAIRDILGAISFLFTACTITEYEDIPYYSAIFSGTNKFLKSVQQFDPIYLTTPSLDEALWNGEILSGWLLDIPMLWPNDKCFDDDVDGAIECFKAIKRKYYFENRDGYSLISLQPDEIKKCADIFTSFESQRKKIKERTIHAINKLFLPSSDNKRDLLIWTTHKYDISQDATIAISSKLVESNDLEILMPRPADWLMGMEYTPDHIILKHKNSDMPKLIIDINFLRTLDAIENGYPIGLLAPQYEQAAANFLRQLDDQGLTEENDDGEILIANRKNNSRMLINIQNGKYGFEEGEN